MTGFGGRWKNGEIQNGSCAHHDRILGPLKKRGRETSQNSLRAHHDEFFGSLKKRHKENLRTACVRIMTEFPSR